MLYWLFAIYGWVLAIIFGVAYVVAYRALQRSWKREDGYQQMIADHVPELRPSLAALRAGKAIAPLLLLLLLPSHSHAQALPIIFGNVADAVSTEYVLRHANAREANPILGQYVYQRVIVKSLGTVAQVWIVRRIGREHPRLAKGIGYSAGAVLTSIAIHNVRVLK